MKEPTFTIQVRLKRQNNNKNKNKKQKKESKTSYPLANHSKGVNTNRNTLTHAVTPCSNIPKEHLTILLENLNFSLQDLAQNEGKEVTLFPFLNQCFMKYYVA